MKFPTWLKTAWTNTLSWFGLESQKVASFLYPIFQEAEVLVKKDVLGDIIDGLPIVAAAFAGVANPADGLAAALSAAEGYILPILEKQGVTLAQTTINTLANGLVAQAQASASHIPAVASDPIVPGSAAEIVAVVATTAPDTTIGTPQPTTAPGSAA